MSLCHENDASVLDCDAIMAERQAFKENIERIYAKRAIHSDDTKTSREKESVTKTRKNAVRCLR
jgi:hypothetical protein